jgi:cytochrome c-type biogenesis protein CcmH/NrfG
VRAFVGVLVMTALLGLYFVVAGQRAVVLLTSGDGVAIGIGVALLVLPLLGAALVAAELAFGFRSQRLARILESEEALPIDDLPRRPSGRPLREAADAEFGRYKAAVEANPQSWRDWFRLGLAYDASGDRRRARAAIRQAIRLERKGAAA